MLLTTETFVAMLAITGIVIVVSALLSGFIERTGLPQVAVFLAIGAALGPAGLGLLEVGLDSPLLRVVATISLALVLFTDAVTLNMREVRTHGALALRVLGPGTLLSAGVIALIAWQWLGLAPAAAAILGAALASTDPVLLRPLLKSKDMPADARQALQLESGLNDVVLLPVIIVAMALLGGDQIGWGTLFLQLFVLGPGAGVAVGLVGVGALDLIRKRVGVRRDYESLYSLGIAFSAFAAAEAMHGSGFLAAFAAGLTISALDVELCDCFVEYGEVTAEMLLLFTFVLFGSSLIWTGFTILDGGMLLFAVVALLVRPPVYLLSLLGSRVPWKSRGIIAWFGPRGLSSLLLILVPVFVATPGSDHLFRIAALVVLLSVLLHGGSPLVLRRVHARRESMAEAEAEARAAPTTTEAGDTAGAGDDTRIPDRIALDELRRRQEAGEKVVLLDVRTARSFAEDQRQAAGAVRMVPERVAEKAARFGLPRDAWVAAYCT